jgi:hypothetical protein
MNVRHGLVLAFVLLLWQPANGQDARQLFVLEDGTAIQRLGNGQWAEYNAGGGLRRQLREVTRGPEFIELTTNVPQSLNVRLFRTSSQFKLNAPGGVWTQWKGGVWRAAR